MKSNYNDALKQFNDGKVNEAKEILYPGQSKQRRYKKNLNKKINIPSNVAEDLKKLN